ncbi:MAG: N-6 DNA methylase [Candidatus Nanohaloarchaea archaeon]
MTKYENLDASTELEQEIASDLESAFSKRGVEVEHLGSKKSHAPPNKPDILLKNDSTVITVEPTKSTGASQDREFNAIREHLQETDQDNPEKQSYCIFVSPETSSRMLDSIEEHNFHRRNQEAMKILPLSFDTLEIIVNKLSGSVADAYPFEQFLELFSRHSEFIDDQRIKKLISKELFEDDQELEEEIEREEKERDQELLENLIEDLENLEDYLREQGIATGEKAIDTLIYLVFIKLYEERRVRKGDGPNRLKKNHFQNFKKNQKADVRREDKAIHELFNTIKSEEEFHETGMFSDRDRLPEELTDNFILDKVMPVFNKYNFLGTKIDALGAVYEVLALRANKDVKVGQFFTPENIVDFMVNLADLDIEDRVLDPACGTGRFLIEAMQKMLDEVDKSSVRGKEKKKEDIKHNQLFGSDIDSRIAKIAKMNMWIHGDGKTNILKHNGLKLNDVDFDGGTFENSTDVILTNPPLGKLNYKEGYNKEFRERMKPVLPVKNTTKDRLDTIKDRLKTHKEEKKEMENRLENLKETKEVKEYLKLSDKGNLTSQEKERLEELEDLEDVKDFERLPGKISRKQKTIDRNEEEKKELEVQIKKGNSEYEITGTKIKGGGLFLKVAEEYLDTDRDPEAPPEWRGGKLVTVLDEGILNTSQYKRVRRYIKENFYIKAMISLTSDTFVPVSNTNTKTSILYAIKKENKSDKQKEPIFFAHVDKVGLDTKGKACDNHLRDVLDKFSEFKSAVKESYKEKEFREDLFQNKEIETEIEVE